MEFVTVKLKTHRRNFSEEDLVVNTDALSREKLPIQNGDVLELRVLDEHLPSHQRHCLLLPVKPLPAEVQTKGGPLSVSEEVARVFNLVGAREVGVRRVEREDFSLDLLELRFRDQHLTRSDMWRFSCSLIDGCVYMEKKLEFAGVRAQVHSLWTNGSRVQSGVITVDTRVVFRSASCQLFLYLQICSEMWDFDPSGDLYFDKAVTGFLKDLFERWKEQRCNHEVTVVFFSRLYYAEKAVENLFPAEKEYLQQDKRGQLYQDLYKVVVEGESVEEWGSHIRTIKSSFLKFQQRLDSRKEQGATVSVAAKGNILEAINLAINVFEQHHVDCHLHRSGHQVAVVSPGTGVFEVDRELTRLTKQRVIDGGIGVDLICLTAQPLHAVPLFQFLSSDSLQDKDYHIPHWINYGFFNPPYSRKLHFSPHLQLSDHLVNVHLNRVVKPMKLFNPSHGTVNFQPPVDQLFRVDYEQYDGCVFTVPQSAGKAHSASKVTGSLSAKEFVRHHSIEGTASSPASGVSQVSFHIGTDEEEEDDPFSVDCPVQPPDSRHRTVKIKVPQRSRDVAFSSSLKFSRGRSYSEACDEPQSLDKTDTPSALPISVGSAEVHRQLLLPRSSLEPFVRKKRTFINPFDPSKVHAELTAYYRRWMHTFPLSAEGCAFQIHHRVSSEQQRERGGSSSSDRSLSGSMRASSPKSSQKSGSLLQTGASQPKTSSPKSSLKPARSPQAHRKRHMLLFPVEKKGSFEVQPKVWENFSNTPRTGMDWQSLTEPACLPITTDFFPSDSVLSRDYYEYPSKLVVSDYGNTSSAGAMDRRAVPWRSDHQSMTTFQAFKEMLAQRIAQGFQLVFDPSSRRWGQTSVWCLHRAISELEEAITAKRRPQRRDDIAVNLSLGHVFHKIELTYPHIVVSIYRAKAHSEPTPMKYCYQLLLSDDAQDSGSSDGVKSDGVRGDGERGDGVRGDGVRGDGERVATSFRHDRVEDYNWNYLDQHVCGYSDFDLLGESQKYWRCRYLLLPQQSPFSSPEQRESLIASFCRYMEFLNHIKRPPSPAAKPPALHRNNSLPVWGSETHSSHTSPTPTPTQGHKLEEGQRSRSRPTSPRIPRREDLEDRNSRRYSRVKEGRDSDSKTAAVGQHGATSGLWRSRSKEELSSPHLLRKEKNEERPESPFRRKRNAEEVLRTLRDLALPERREQLKSVETAPVSKIVSLEVIPATPSALDKSFDSSFVAIPSPPASPSHRSVSTSSSPEEILKAMEDPETGVDFLPAQNGLQGGCFVSMEAVQWAVEKVEGVGSRFEAIHLLEGLLDAELAVHASRDSNVPFIDGFFLYCVTGRAVLDEPPREVLEHSYLVIDSMDFDSFSKRWFEAEVHFPYTHTGSHTPSPSFSSPSSSHYYMNYEQKDHKLKSVPASVMNRYIELNPDPQFRSDRPEWCIVRYSHYYKPSHAFQFEFQWMVATCSLFQQMIQSWVHKASMCGFNLVPVPSLSFPHPFRRPLFIPLSLPRPVQQQWRGGDSGSSDQALRGLFCAIASRCGFLVDPSGLPADSDVLPVSLGSQSYVHHTGCALIQPVWGEGGREGGWEGVPRSLSNPLNSSTPVEESCFLGNQSFLEEGCGFLWYRNHLLSKHKSSLAGVRAYHAPLLEKFRSLCSNKDGQLASLCEEVLN